MGCAFATDSAPEATAVSPLLTGDRFFSLKHLLRRRSNASIKTRQKPQKERREVYFQVNTGVSFSLAYVKNICLVVFSVSPTIRTQTQCIYHQCCYCSIYLTSPTFTITCIFYYQCSIHLNTTSINIYQCIWTCCNVEVCTPK